MEKCHGHPGVSQQERSHRLGDEGSRGAVNAIGIGIEGICERNEKRDSRGATI